MGVYYDTGSRRKRCENVSEELEKKERRRGIEETRIR